MFYIQNALTTSNSAKTACNLGGGGYYLTQMTGLKIKSTNFHSSNIQGQAGKGNHVLPPPHPKTG